jgi:circadian clock protein KaiC
LQVVRNGGERNRVLTIIKSRGMAHSNQASEYRLGRRGFELMDTYLGATGVLTGSARAAQEAEDRSAADASGQKISRMQQERERRRRLLENRISALREEFAGEDAAIERSIREGTRRRDRLLSEREAMGRSRHAFGLDGNPGKPSSKERRP